MFSHYTLADFQAADAIKTFDNGRRNEAQYQKGLEIGRTYQAVSIAINDTWGARDERGSLTSYEKIGCHAGTGSLFQGFKDSGVEITLYRIEADTLTRHTLQ